MTEEAPANLEQVLGKLDQWMLYRFDEGYTARNADALKQEISGSLDSSMGESRIEIITNQFDKGGLFDYFRDFISRSYVVAKKALDVINSPRNPGVEEIAGFYRRTIDFVEGFCRDFPDQVDLVEEDVIEEAFIEAYDSTQAFSLAVTANVKVLDQERQRQRKSRTEYNQDSIFPNELIRSMREGQKRDNLFIDETLRMMIVYMPRVFEKVIGDLYR